MQERPDNATWWVPDSGTPSPDRTWRLLQSLHFAKWHWDMFLWDLRGLLRVLTTTPSEFTYLFVTAFLKARAAYLACNGPFDCAQQEILIGLGMRRVQFASIYYRLFVRTLREVLDSDAGQRLIGAREERLFSVAIATMERQYIEILEVICLGAEPGVMIHGLDVESWATGTELSHGKRVRAVPEPVQVNAMVQRMGSYLLVRASPDEMVKKIISGDYIRSFLLQTDALQGPEMEMAKLSRRPRVKDYPVVRYGAMEFQYFVTLTNTKKRILYVVCADRTMRIHQVKGMEPASKPISIEPSGLKAGEVDLYLVKFDNGKQGFFTITFRSHNDSEHEHVPDDVLAGTEPGSPEEPAEAVPLGNELATVQAAEKTLAPVVEIFEKAVLASTPPHKRKWWQNARAAYDREPGPLEADKWRAVARLVVAGAIEANKKPPKERHSDYLTPLMLARLIKKLNAPGASRAEIEATYAVVLRRYVAREEQKAGAP